jgi:hypothetical protein
MIATHIDTWFKLLEDSCVDAAISSIDLIIDQARNADFLLRSVLSVEPPLLWHPLFSGLAEEGDDDLMPLQVRVDLAQPLQRFWLINLIEHYQNNLPLLLLASRWPFETLAEHFGACAEARHGNDLGLFRFYSARLLPQLLSHVLDPEQQQLLLRPVVFWSWLDRDGAPQYLPGEDTAPAHPEAPGPIVLDDLQMAALRCAGEASQLVDNLPRTSNAEQRFQTCFAALLEACQAGLLLKPERAAFALARLHGQEKTDA